MKNILLCLSAAVLISACASSTSNQPLYHWDNTYSKSVYNHLNKNSDANMEIAQMEKAAQKAYEKHQKIPPGFYAHLGLLYHDAGNMEKMKENFQKEVELYEESKTYINFLLKNKGGK
ncbi:MAG: DUF4810 domain-containing protein [Neisseriaceae bacterium]|nr:DUF4810 domain-containing protein [Neisseriaceae bacterium]